MTRAPKLRLLAILAVVASLAMASLASPVLGALANVDIGGGSVVNEHPRAATPLQVSPGNVAGFYLWLTNEDSANLPTFFLNAGSPATPVGAYWKSDTEQDSPWHSCSTANGLMCNFGAFTSGESIFVVAGFDTPTSSSTTNCKPATAPQSQGYGPTTETSYVCVDFQFGANQGFVPGKNKSRGDIYHWYDFVATDTTDDEGAQFPFCDLGIPAETRDCDEGLLTVFNTLSATRRNVQATQVTAPAAAFDSDHGSSAIAVADNTDFVACPALTPECAARADDFLGQWSDVSVNSEEVFLNTEFVHVTIQMYGVKASDVDGVLHLWQVADGPDPDLDPDWREEVIDDLCPSAAGPTGTDPCFWVSGSGNNATVDVWSHNNGKFGNF